MNKKLIYLIAVILLFSFIVPVWLSQPASASRLSESVNKTAEQAQLNQNNSLSEVVSMIIKGLLGLLGLVFFILIVYGGYTWMTAMGAEEKVKKAKNTIVSATIGLLIIILSYAIVSYVISLLNDRNAY